MALPYPRPTRVFCTMGYEFPPRFAELKQSIAASVPDFESRVTKSWIEVIQELEKVTEEIAKTGPDYIPQVNFSDINNISPAQIDVIKRRGSVVVKDVVPDEDALKWKATLDNLIKTHPDIPGFPEDRKQFIQAYWTQPQVQARSHPNMLKVQAWLNSMYHAKSGLNPDGVDLSTPLTYADRFRIRHPGGHWGNHPPHIDGGTIERWEDPTFRACFADILGGDWRKHDAYNLDNRVKAKSSLYGRENQASVFRTYQGWIALEEIHPHQGTLQVFPDVLLANAYIILRPFFVFKGDTSANIYDLKNWSYDVTSSNFPGILPGEKGYQSTRPTTETHPHLRLERSMTSMPPVNPGDTVFWHCDGIHAVEPEHTGTKDSAVVYIPAVPTTPMNLTYVQKQKESFLAGMPPADYPQGQKSEHEYAVASGGRQDILSDDGQRALGF